MHRAYKQKAFTIVELLIVIAVIGILAAVTIVVFNGIRDRAIESALKADLNTAAKKLEEYNIVNSGYPIGLSTIISPSGSNAFQFTSYGQTSSSVGTSYCVTAFASGSSVDPYHYFSDTRSIEPGYCPGHNDNATSTLAGAGTAGFADGAGAVAQFSSPSGMAMYNDELFVADTGNNRIRKITANGDVSTLAGSGVAGTADGTGAAAQFNFPTSIAIAPNGTIYVADLLGHRIRQVTQGGVVTTLAGSTSGFTDATGTSARFSSPVGVTVASDGSIYVADRGNNRIRRVTSGGVVTTIAGAASGFADATGTSARFNSPNGITIDSSDNLYVADDGNNRIRKVTTGGVTTTLAGSGVAGYADGPGISARFSQPGALRIGPDGALYVADWDNWHTYLRKVNVTTGDVEPYTNFVRGSGAVDGVGASAQFNVIGGIVFAPDGTLYLVGTYNNRVAKIVD